VFLDGSNTYSGGTKIEAGTLTINGSLADASMSIVSVTLSAVNYAGTVDGTGTLTFNIDGAANDQIKMTSATSPVGTLTATDLKIAVNATGAGLTESEYVLVDATGGGTITGTFASLTGAPGYELNYGTPNQIKLVKVGGGSPYGTWSGGAAADADTNGDGVDNGVAWVVGAANPSANAIGLIPTLDNTTDPDFFIFNYRRNDLAAADPKTSMKVQYSSGLSAWTDATQGADIVITPSNDFYAVGIDKVEVKIRRTLAVGGKLFARLNVAVSTP
jgi:autotransporter-associated beta strand protein